MAYVQTINSNRFTAIFNNRNLLAVKGKVDGKFGKVDAFTVTDTDTQEVLHGEELKSFTSLLAYHQLQKQLVTNIPTVRTMKESGKVNHDH